MSELSFAGKNIQGFQIQHSIGEGGMSVVYLAENSIGKKAAIKILRQEFFFNKAVRQRFRQEASILANLSHPNIRQVHDLVETEQYIAIIMEYLEGESLNSIVMRKGAIDEVTLKGWFTSIFSAVQFIHTKGLTHRDIKPSNIFLTQEGEVKLLDFGTARVNETLGLTKTGVITGTPTYMSPEQIRSPRDVDFRTDIYSLGVMLYFLSSGTKPYDEATESEYNIQTRIINEPLATIEGGTPELNYSILRATLKDRNERFASCQEFADVLSTKIPISEEEIAKITQKSFASSTPLIVTPRKVKPLTSNLFNTSSADEDEDNRRRPLLWIILPIAGAIFLAALFALRAFNSEPDTHISSDNTNAIVKANEWSKGFRTGIATAKNSWDSLIVCTNAFATAPPTLIQANSVIDSMGNVQNIINIITLRILQKSGRSSLVGADGKMIDTTAIALAIKKQREAEAIKLKQMEESTASIINNANPTISIPNKPASSATATASPATSTNTPAVADVPKRVEEPTKVVIKQPDPIKEEPRVPIRTADPVRTNEDPNKVFTVAEQQPQFPGGDKALSAYLAKKVYYPQAARERGTQGKVLVSFVVGKAGEIRDVKITRGIGGGCDEEAIRVVKSMPLWNPGKQNGKAVSVQYTIPVSFVLQEE